MGKIGDSNTNSCSVPECKSRSTNEIKLFPFPKDETLRKKWTDAMKIESKTTQNMQVCSRHFVKSDYITSVNAGAKVRRLKRLAVPSQNLPWKFPNKRVSPTLVKARMERLKNRSLQKVSESSDSKSETSNKKTEIGKKAESDKKTESVSKSSAKTKYPEIKKDSESITIELDSENGEDATENAAHCSDVKKDDSDVIEDDKAIEKDGKAPEAKKDDDEPARAPTRLRQSEAVIKCEICGRKCLTPQALQTHQQNAHKNTKNNLTNLKKDSTVINKGKTSPKPFPVGLISVKSPENLLAKPPAKGKPMLSLNSFEVEKMLQDDSDYNPSSSDSDVSVKEEVVGKQNQRKTEFECPKCKRRFAVYFMAYKHIQKHHSGTPNGSKLANLPKPIRIQICTICNTVLDGDSHRCAGLLKFGMGFICTGCEQEYKTLTMFDMHKSSMHSDGVQSMFFSALDEFEEWKQKMENQTRSTYTTQDQNDTKKIYRCTHRTPVGAEKITAQRMCPSCIVVQEFTKGFQVHYYPIHYEHSHQKYNLSEAFKRYSITSLMNLTANQLPDSDDDQLGTPDLYLQFKKITERLVNEAARINVNGLKKLMRKALDMMEIINSYVEDDDDDGITSSNSVLKLDSDKDDLQDEVRLALSSLKRKSESVNTTVAKKKKSVFKSTENTPKGVGNKVTSSLQLSTTKGTENVKSKEPLKINQSPKFIDTFQEFVGKSLTNDEKKKRQSDGKKTPTMKTKMGQFKPKTPPKKVSFSPTPKKSTSPRKSNVKEIEYEVKEQENDCNILILKI